MKSKYLMYILCVCCLLWTYSYAFAQNSNESLSNTTQFAIFFTNLLSRIRIPIANLTGKMMSNTLATWEVFGISDFLFKCWIIIRGMSNFIILWIVFSIIWEIVKSWAAKDVGKKVVNLILAWLFINVSWFMMWWLIDLANLTIFGVSNIWSSIINSNPTVMRNIALQTVCLPKKLDIDPNSTIYTKTIDPTECQNENYEIKANQIIPRYDDLSGPFMYFGLAVMRTFEFNDIQTASTDSWSAINSLKDISINLIFKIFMLFMFITPLIALLIMNAARILYIWIRFICSPLIILHFFFSDSNISRLKSLLSSGELGLRKSKWSFFDIKNIIWALMTPAVTLATMFLSILIISTMYGWLAWWDTWVNGNLGAIESQSSSFRETLDSQWLSIDGRKISVWKDYSMDLQWDIIQDSAWLISWWFGFIIMNILMMWLLWSIYRVSLSTSTILAGIWNRVMDAWKRTITQWIKLPIGIWWADISLDQMNKQVLDMWKVEWMFKDNYIKPTVNAQRTLASKTATRRMQKLGFTDVLNTYSSPESFNWGKFKFENRNNTSKKAKNEEFILESSNFFNKVIGNIISEEAEVKPSTPSRTSAIQSWANAWWLEFLVEINSDFKKEYDDNKKYRIINKDADGKEVETKDIDFNKLFSESKHFGWFIKKVFSKDFINDFQWKKITTIDDYKRYTGTKAKFNDIGFNYKQFL